MPDSQIDGIDRPPSPTGFLFICTGNICRSPLAEVIARSMFENVPFAFSSAGTHAVDGDVATQHAQTTARDRGLDLSIHRARRLDQCEPPDIAFGMEEHHLVAARRTFPALDVTRIRLLDGPNAVTDPYGRDLDVYEAAAAHIERALETLPALYRDIVAGNDERS